MMKVGWIFADNLFGILILEKQRVKEVDLENEIEELKR